MNISVTELIIGGAIALVGKIVWDWLVNRNKGKYITVEILEKGITDLKNDIKKDFELLLEKMDNKYVPWAKYDSLKDQVDELEKIVAVISDAHHKNHGG
jgi:hypothetical protein